MINRKFYRILENFMPYLILGIIIALMIGFFILFSYVLVWGLVIGALLWGIALIKNYFSSSKLPAKTKKGRVIEQENDK